MRIDEYDPNCDGCKISQGHKEVTGKLVIEMNGGWTLNHYGGGEGFLGWLALQPRYHRMELADLTEREAAFLGPNIQRIDLALRQYWSIRFDADPIERVYVVYFLEGVFAKPNPSPYHLHVHLIPRTRRFDPLLRKDNGSTSTIIAWNIYQLVECQDFPEEYRIKGVNKQYTENLMAYLKSSLWKSS